MTGRSKTFGAGSLLAGGYVIEHGLQLVRTVLLARLLGPEDFGVAVTVLLLVTTFTMITDLGIEKYLIYVPDSDVQRTQWTLTTIVLLRGLLTGGCMFLLSGQIAALFGHPDLGWLYATAALIPILDGLRHLDALRQQRQMRFLSILLVQVGGLFPGVAVAVIVAQLTGSYSAVLWGSLVTSAVSLALSHLLAVERYQVRIDMAVLRGVLVYGMPLLLNGLVILIGNQGDRLLVALLQDAANLGTYFAISSLTVGASLILSKLIGNLYLPMQTASRNDPVTLLRRHELCGALSIAILFVTMLPMAAFGDLLVRLLFGTAFDPAPLLSACLAVQAAFRVLRSWPVVGSLSSGKTKDILYANLLRMLGVGAAIGAVQMGAGLLGVALCVTVGEIVGTFYALLRMDRINPGTRRLGMTFGSLMSGVFALTVAIESVRYPMDELANRFLATTVSMSAGFLALMVASPELRSATRQEVRKILMRLGKGR